MELNKEKKSDNFESEVPTAKLDLESLGVPLDEFGEPYDEDFQTTKAFQLSELDFKKGVPSQQFYDLKYNYDVVKDEDNYNYNLKKANSFFENEKNFLRLEAANTKKNFLMKSGVSENDAKIAAHQYIFTVDFTPHIAEAIAVEDFRIAKEEKDRLSMYLTGGALALYLATNPVVKRFGVNLVGGTVKGLTRNVDNFIKSYQRYKIEKGGVPIDKNIYMYGQKIGEVDNNNLDKLFLKFDKDEVVKQNLSRVNNRVRDNYEDLNLGGINTVSQTIRGLQNYPNYELLSTQKIISPSLLKKHLEDLPIDNKAILNSAGSERIFKSDLFFELWDKNIFTDVEGNAISSNPDFDKIANTSTLKAIDDKLEEYGNAILNAKDVGDGNWRFEFNNRIIQINDRSVPSYPNDSAYNKLSIPEKYLKNENDKIFNFINRQLQKVDKTTTSTNIEVDVFGGAYPRAGSRGNFGIQMSDLDKMSSTELAAIDNNDFIVFPPKHHQDVEIPYDGMQTQLSTGLVLKGSKVEDAESGVIVLRSPADESSNIHMGDGRKTGVFVNESLLQDSFVSLKKSLEDNPNVFVKEPTVRELLFGTNKGIKEIRDLGDSLNKLFLENQIVQIISNPKKKNLPEHKFLKELISISMEDSFELDLAQQLIENSLAKFPAETVYRINIPTKKLNLPSNFKQLSPSEQQKFITSNLEYMTYEMTRDEVSQVFFSNYNKFEQPRDYPTIKEFMSKDDFNSFYAVRNNLMEQTNKLQVLDVSEIDTHFDSNAIGHTRFFISGDEVVIDEIQFDLLRGQFNNFYEEGLKSLQFTRADGSIGYRNNLNEEMSKRAAERYANEFASEKILKSTALPFKDSSDLIQQIMTPLILNAKKNNANFITLPSIENLANVRTSAIGQPMTTYDTSKGLINLTAIKGGILSQLRKKFPNAKIEFNNSFLFGNQDFKDKLAMLRSNQFYGLILNGGNVPVNRFDENQLKIYQSFTYTGMPRYMKELYGKEFDKGMQELILKSNGKIKLDKGIGEYTHIPANYINLAELDRLERIYSINEDIQTWKGITNRLDGRTPDKVGAKEFADFTAVQNYPEDPVVLKKFANLVKYKLFDNPVGYTRRAEIFMDTVGIDKKATSFKTRAEFKQFVENLPDEKFKEYYIKTNAELTDFENVMKNGITKEYESKTIDIRNILNDRRPEQLNTTRVLTMAEGGLVNA